jgi:flavin reductase (DIM6/NTAB) family NADH-FMN oxidoreductase RutF
MRFVAKLRSAVRSFLLGQSGFSTAFDLPLQSPQTEVAVWLHGLGEPRDVTFCHSVACPMPCIFCIAFETDGLEQAADHQRVSLHFVERTASSRLLGQIDLDYQDTITTTGPELRLYRATACIETCLPSYRRWMRSLYLARERWKALRSGRSQISSLDSRCNEIVFFCPRPIVLVSLFHGSSGNIFPMNLMGMVEEGYFVFALNRSKKSAGAVAAAAELAISTIPFEHAELARGLGPNHSQNSIDFARLPFGTFPSRTLGIPVPEFSLAVRELRVEKVLPLGSHDFFVARIIGTQVHVSAPEFYRIHGLYAAHCRRA